MCCVSFYGYSGLRGEWYRCVWWFFGLTGIRRLVAECNVFLVLWDVLVARSGSNKSYPMKLVANPLRKIDAELYATYKEEHDAWKSIPNKDRNGDEPKTRLLICVVR